MFRPLLEYLNPTPIRYQIRVFLKWRLKHGLGSMDYGYWLDLFLKKTRLDDVEDITENHLIAFIHWVEETRNGRHPPIEAERVLRQFMRFYRARGREIGRLSNYKDLVYTGGRVIIEDTKRNRKLVMLREKNPVKWSWRRLGDYFGIHFTTARELYQKHHVKYGKAGRLKV